MSLLVDTSVWSSVLRRDTPDPRPASDALRKALTDGTEVATTGIILFELLRGAVPQRARDAIQQRFAALRYLEPGRDDYIAAAELSNTCRASGVQLPLADSLIAQLAIRHDLVLLTLDRDFFHASVHIPLGVWDGESTGPRPVGYPV